VEQVAGQYLCHTRDSFRREQAEQQTNWHQCLQRMHNLTGQCRQRVEGGGQVWGWRAQGRGLDLCGQHFLSVDCDVSVQPAAPDCTCAGGRGCQGSGVASVSSSTAVEMCCCSVALCTADSGAVAESLQLLKKRMHKQQQQKGPPIGDSGRDPAAAVVELIRDLVNEYEILHGLQATLQVRRAGGGSSSSSSSRSSEGHQEPARPAAISTS